MNSNRSQHPAHIYAKWRKASEEFYDHVITCKKCNPHFGIYCIEGTKLKILYEEAFDEEK